MNSIPIICYSHSTYSDVWDIFFGQLEKYFPNNKKYLFTDSVVKDIPKDVEVILYDDKLSYSKRLSSCLSKLEEDIVLFHHEDMILYDKPNVEKLNELYNFLKTYEIDYIKLLKGGHDFDVPLDNMPVDNLYWIPHDGKKLSFAIQPTIWKSINF